MEKKMQNNCTQKSDCKDSTDGLEKKKEVYSIRITTRQKNLIRNNKEIKEDLDRYVISYLKSFF